MDKIYPVILCGGSGTRLWPRSRAVKPKPFLPLMGSSSLFEQTLERVGDRALFGPPAIIAGKAHRALVQEQAGRTDGVRMIEEPLARNTAPAIGLAALRAEPDDVLLVCPSDHYIADIAAFTAAAQSAARLASQGWLVAFGIAPTHPETGFGYIRRGAALEAGFQVGRFVEKPDAETARAFLADGGYSWNGGIFCFRADRYIEELAMHRPAMARSLRDAGANGIEEAGIFHPDAGAFAAIKGESIDYAVMENTARAAMVPVSMGWSDIGNWAALQEQRETDADGNSVRGKADLVQCRNVLIESDGPRVSAIGLEDVIIVVDGDEVLVTRSGSVQQVGTLPGACNQ